MPKKKIEIDTKLLRAKIKRATQYGPFEIMVSDAHNRDVDHPDHNPDPDQLRYRLVDGDGCWLADFGQDPDNPAAYEAFPPEVIGALLDEIDALRKRISRGKR